MNLYKYLITGMFILLIMPIVACSDSSNTGLDIEAELEALRQNCAINKEVQSYRMDGFFTHTEDDQTVESTLEAEFVAPESYHTKVHKDEGWEETIIISPKVYSRDSGFSGPRQGQCCPNVLEAQKLSLKASIPSAETTFRLLDLLTDLEKLPDDKIDDVDCFHCRGRVDMDQQVEEQIAEVEAKLDLSKPEYRERFEAQKWMWDWQRRWEVNYELWISREDCFIRQQRYETQMPVMESPKGERIRGEMTNTALMHYYDINEPIKIEPPSI